MAPPKGKVKAAFKRVSKSARAGLIFPVTKLKTKLKVALPKFRVSIAAPTYLAAICEYLTAEVLELAGNAAKDNKKKRIVPRHILLAIACDKELNALLKGVTISSGGVLPAIHPALIPKGSQIVGNIAKPARTTGHVTGKVIGRKRKGGYVAAAPSIIKSGRIVKTPVKRKPAGGITTLNQRKLFLGQRLNVISGDIVDVQCDAIVHPTNNSMFLGGEVGTRLSTVGGQFFRNNVSNLYATHGNLNIGSAAMCDGVNFSASYVIHCHSPSWPGANAVADLTKTVQSCLDLADKKNLKSICFPSIGSGRNNFPKQTAAETILRAISAYFKQVMTSTLKEVYFVLHDTESINVYVTELAKLDG